MLHIALAIAPIFILIVLGHLLRRGGIPSFEFWNLDDKLIYWMLMPALLIHQTSTIELAAGVVGAYAVVILGGFAAAVVFSLVAAVAKLHDVELELAGNEPGLKVTLVFPQA